MKKLFVVLLIIISCQCLSQEVSVIPLLKVTKAIVTNNYSISGFIESVDADAQFNQITVTLPALSNADETVVYIVTKTDNTTNNVIVNGENINVTLDKNSNKLRIVKSAVGWKIIE